MIVNLYIVKINLNNGFDVQAKWSNLLIEILDKNAMLFLLLF